MMIGYLFGQPFEGVPAGLDSHATLPRTSHRDGGWTMTSTQSIMLLLIVAAGLMVSCATAPSSSEDKQALIMEATTRMQQMRAEDPAVGEMVNGATATACSPRWGRGASS